VEFSSDYYCDSRKVWWGDNGESIEFVENLMILLYFSKLECFTLSICLWPPNIGGSSSFSELYIFE
jgi:hypothetical protein